MGQEGGGHRLGLGSGGSLGPQEALDLSGQRTPSCAHLRPRSGPGRAAQLSGSPIPGQGLRAQADGAEPARGSGAELLCRRLARGLRGDGAWRAA